jgi:GAF domain-containing protein
MTDQSKTASAPRTEDRQPGQSTADSGARADAGLSGAPGEAAPDEISRLWARVAELQRERDHLVAAVELLQDISASLHFVDILQTIARKLGDTFALDRCAIFLTGDQDEVRLVASYEDPSIRNLVVDINRYPELKRVFETRETVFIPDAIADPSLKAVRSQLEQRNVRSIVVLPLQWEDTVIGAIFLRSDRDAPPFSDADVRFCQVVASLTAKSLRNAHRFESLQRQEKDATASRRRAELQRVALIAFLRRLLDRHAKGEEQSWAETLLPQASGEELERLVAVAMQVLEEEAKG